MVGLFQAYASQYMVEVSLLLRRLPGVLLLLMKTNDCLRAVDNALVREGGREGDALVGRMRGYNIINMEIDDQSEEMNFVYLNLFSFDFLFFLFYNM